MAKITLKSLLGKQRLTAAERNEKRSDHPWRKAPAVVQTDESKESERAAIRAQGRGSRSAAREAGKIAKRRLGPPRSNGTRFRVD